MAQIREIPLAQIRRPLPRQTDPDKVRALMASLKQSAYRSPLRFWKWKGSIMGSPAAIATRHLSAWARSGSPAGCEKRHVLF